MNSRMDGPAAPAAANDCRVISGMCMSAGLMLGIIGVLSDSVALALLVGDRPLVIDDVATIPAGVVGLVGAVILGVGVVASYYGWQHLRAHKL